MFVLSSCCDKLWETTVLALTISAHPALARPNRQARDSPSSTPHRNFACRSTVVFGAT